MLPRTWGRPSSAKPACVLCQVVLATPCCSRIGSGVRPVPVHAFVAALGKDFGSEGSQLYPAESSGLSLAGKGSQAAFSLLFLLVAFQWLSMALLQVCEGSSREGLSLGRAQQSQFVISTPTHLNSAVTS